MVPIYFNLYHLKCISKNGESHHISCTKPTKGTMMGDGKHDSMHFLIQEECLVNDNHYTIFLTVAFFKRIKIVFIEQFYFLIDMSKQQICLKCL